jgi:hypothetical protein
MSTPPADLPASRVPAQELDEVRRRDERVRDRAAGRQAERRDDHAVLLSDDSGARQRASAVQRGEAREVDIVTRSCRAQKDAFRAVGCRRSAPYTPPR